MATKNVQIDWNYTGFRELRSAPGVMAELDRRLQAISDAAIALSGGYEFGWESHVSVPSPQGRGRGTVWPVGIKSIVVNQRDNVLVKALSAGGG